MRDLQFEQKPDYEYLKQLLRKMNTTKTPLHCIKLDYIDLLEKIKIKNQNNKNNMNDNNILNNEESKRATKSNTNNDSLNII